MEYYESDFTDYPLVTCVPEPYVPPRPVPLRKKPSPFQIRCAVSALLCLGILSCKLVWPQGVEKARELLVTDSIGPVEQAMEHMVMGIAAGEELGEAVTVFCQEVLDAQAAD